MRPTGIDKDAPNSVHYVDIVDKATHTLLKREFLATAPEAHLRRVQLEAMLLQPISAAQYSDGKRKHDDDQQNHRP